MLLFIGELLRFQAGYPVTGKGCQAGYSARMPIQEESTGSNSISIKSIPKTLIEFPYKVKHYLPIWVVHRMRVFLSS